MKRPLLALVFCLAAGSVFAKPVLEEIERHDFPVNPDAAISIRVAEGTIHVYGSDENVVHLVAIKKAYTRERLAAIKVDARASQERLVVTTTLPPKDNGLSLADRSGTVDYVLFVPQTCTLEMLEVDTGEAVVGGLRGASVQARLTTGRILIENCFTLTDVSIGRGGLDVTYGWWEPKPFTLAARSSAADITVALPPEASVRFDAMAVDGGIGSAFENDDTKPADGHEREWILGSDPNAQFTLRAERGNIRVARSY